MTWAGLSGLLTVCGQQVVRWFTSVVDSWQLAGWWSAGVRGSLGLALPIIPGVSSSYQVAAAAFLRASPMHVCFSSSCLRPLCCCPPLTGPHWSHDQPVLRGIHTDSSPSGRGRVCGRSAIHPSRCSQDMGCLSPCPRCSLASGCLLVVTLMARVRFLGLLLFIRWWSSPGITASASKESVLSNCVLEKTLESSLACKGIKSVDP